MDFISASPNNTGFPSIKDFFRVPIVLDIRDIWPESAVNMGRIRRGGLVHLAGENARICGLQACGFNYVCLATNEDVLDRRVSKKVEVIYNGVNTHFEGV